MTETERRDGTRLENDDPQHCKKCGSRISVDDVHDSQGRPLSWDSTEQDWVVIERCVECWSDKKLRNLSIDCMERYNGACSKELWER